MELTSNAMEGDDDDDDDDEDIDCPVNECGR
jgi:hypothetical protein